MQTGQRCLEGRAERNCAFLIVVVGGFELVAEGSATTRALLAFLGRSNRAAFAARGSVRDSPHDGRARRHSLLSSVAEGSATTRALLSCVLSHAHPCSLLSSEARCFLNLPRGEGDGRTSILGLDVYPSMGWTYVHLFQVERGVRGSRERREGNPGGVWVKVGRGLGQSRAGFGSNSGGVLKKPARGARAMRPRVMRSRVRTCTLARIRERGLRPCAHLKL